ncbi:MAG: metallophosphoesterase [Ruminococcaceae bacterium]|nr:metallophosphoesterase [Oscillospiraceae bacterium]
MYMKRKNVFLRMVVCIFLLTAVLVSAWTLWADNAVKETFYTVESDRLPSAFGGFRIAHVTDLHNDTLGDDNAALLAQLQRAQPDIIAVTGDLIDCRVPNMQIALAFMQKAVQIAPVYYVTGNHEAALYAEYPSFEKQLIQVGVTVLNNEAVTLTKNGQTITLLGLADPNATTMDSNDRISLMQTYTAQGFTVVLSHRPEIFDEYCTAQADLVLTGHAHGGQIRIPFIGGIYAPGQGLLPEYDAGVFTRGNTVMYISRGIGNSLFPIRFNNRPELPVITLQTTAIG